TRQYSPLTVAHSFREWSQRASLLHAKHMRRGYGRPRRKWTTSTMSANTRRMWIRPPATWKTNPPRIHATNRMTNAIRNRDRNTALSFSASPPTKSPGGSASGMARSALPESLGEPEAALGAAEPLHSHAQVLATGLALAERHPCTVRIGAPSAYWTLVQYSRPVVVLSILLV